MTNTLKKIIIPIIIAALLFAGYNFFLKGDGAENLLKVTAASSDESYKTEIIRSINKISTLKLDRTIFDDPIFSTLIDRSEKIEDEKTGRDNPFAVIGITNSVSTSTSGVKSATTSMTTKSR